ncbi:MAG TPA: hypothetical protein VM869_31165, partial [Enhygromyxa sp.]|nr:hypothetical protein [Enhygromyxa sp.]
MHGVAEVPGGRGAAAVAERVVLVDVGDADAGADREVSGYTAVEGRRARAGEGDVVIDTFERDRLAERGAHERAAIERAMPTVAREIGNLIADAILEGPVQLETVLEAAQAGSNLAAHIIVGARHAGEPGAHQQPKVDYD